MKISEVWLLPPLAFGRVGSSDKPCQSFSWKEPPKGSPDGSDKTILTAERTIEVDNDGIPSVLEADTFTHIKLKDDKDRFHPVCPFFELHGIWKGKNGKSKKGPITEDILKKAGLSLSDVVWRVEVANLKAYHYTLADGDRITAEVEIKATDTTRKELNGLSPKNTVSARLSPGPTGVIFGSVQAIQPTSELPGLRLRIYAPKGVVYAPSNLAEKVSNDPDWQDFKIPKSRQILNTNAKWPNYTNSSAPGPLQDDARVNPAGLAAKSKETKTMLGLVDDVSDGLVQCTIGNLDAVFARIAIGPPDFSPSTRPIVSLQDGLADRKKRDEIRNSEISLDDLETLVADIFERAFETSDLVNKDVQNIRAQRINKEDYNEDLQPPSEDFEQPPRKTLWSNAAFQKMKEKADELPISSRGKRAHKRLNMIEYLKERLTNDPDYITKWLRPPLDSAKAYDRRMPALMRGSDRLPMHLTRRQFEIINLWASKLINKDLSSRENKK